MRDRLKKMICLTLASCLLAGCGKASATGKATVTSENKGPATEQSIEPEPIPTSTPEPTPEPEAFTDVQALGDFSEGLAFAMVTLPDGSQEYAYITRDGNIAFSLPDGYVYGWPFHDGYAAICDEAIDFISSKDSQTTHDAQEHKYNLVDKAGNLCFTEDTYCFIGTVSEGKVLTRTIKEDYTGTEDVFSFRNLDEEIVWEVVMEQSKRLVMPWRSYYQNGKVWIFSESGWSGATSTCYDEQGNRTDNTTAGWNADPNHTYEWFFGIEKRQISVTNWALATHDVVYQPMTGEKYEIDLLQEIYGGIMPSGVPFVNDRMIVRKDTRYEMHDRPDGDKGFYIFDRNGNIVVNNDDLPITSIDYTRTCIDGHWIVKLENDYYGVLNTEGGLEFEPVEGIIYHMGDDLYFLSGTNEVVDSTGAVQYSIPDGCEFYSSNGGNIGSIMPLDFNSPDGRYHEGIATVKVRTEKVKRFIDRSGHLLVNASDFVLAS